MSTFFILIIYLIRRSWTYLSIVAALRKNSIKPNNSKFEAKQKLIPAAFIIAYVYYFFHEGRESKWSLEL